jgi:signal transduction histidine kinase/ActR/RegA family two-component response regulator
MSEFEGKLAFLEGGGQVGALMRVHDWSSSPLGHPRTWPQSLRSVVGLLLNSKFPMFVAWGEDLGFLYNDAYAEILAGKHPRSLGAKFYDIWSEIWPDIWPLIEAAMAGIASYRENLPLTMMRKGFVEQTWFTFSYSPVRDESGAVAGMFCAVAETTAQVLAEQEALAERKILADIVENTDAFVQVSDMDYHWLAINKAAADEFEHIFGVRPKVGLNMLDLLKDYPQHREAVKRPWSRALAGEQFTEIGEFGDPARDRRVYEMKFNTLRNREGRQIGAYQFVYDVTERLNDQVRLAQAQDQLRQAQKMETIGQLTGGVAHDFNNLLTPIVGALDLLRRKGQPDERSQRLTSAALQAAERARVLVQRLLAFSRRQYLQPRAVDIQTLVESIADLVSRSLGPRISLVLNIDKGLPAAHVDPNQLELALLNLAVNSRDAMSGQGTLTISAYMQTASGRPTAKPGKYIGLAVRDTGIGMDEETLRRAIEPFFTTKGVGRGTGLGLSSVQGLAEQSGGHFQLESQPGKGTTATLWLPVSEEAAADATVSLVPDTIFAKAENRSILLVDDEELVRVGVADMLTEAGYVVTQASSGYQALRYLEDGLKIEALITDFAMPGMTGVELAQEALALRPDLQVMLITGYDTRMDQSTVGLPRLAKPFRQADLAEAVAGLLRDRKVLRLPPRISSQHL